MQASFMRRAAATCLARDVDEESILAREAEFGVRLVQDGNEGEMLHTSVKGEEREVSVREFAVASCIHPFISQNTMRSTAYSVCHNNRRGV